MVGTVSIVSCFLKWGSLRFFGQGLFETNACLWGLDVRSLRSQSKPSYLGPRLASYAAHSQLSRVCSQPCTPYI
jgi:hypothetical protein